ncbi:MAG: CopD family protein [Natronospirillum sp.]
MVWFLVLHISTLLGWISALLYLPVLISSSSVPGSDSGHVPARFDSVARFLFTRVATPLALAAIIAGTAVFLIELNTTAWLMAKLTLVVGLVVCHTLVGLLVVRAEVGEHRGLRWKCLSLAVVICALILGILWLVLAKPSADTLLGGLL